MDLRLTCVVAMRGMRRRRAYTVLQRGAQSLYYERLYGHLPQRARPTVLAALRITPPPTNKTGTTRVHFWEWEGRRRIGEMAGLNTVRFRGGTHTSAHTCTEALALLTRKL